MKMTEYRGTAIAALIALFIWGVLFLWIGGEGYYTFLFFIHVPKSPLAAILAFLFSGIYVRLCIVVIPPNHQGIVVFLGRQTGAIWGEGWWLIPWPLYWVWKSVSTEIFTINASARARSSDGHHIMVIGKCIVRLQNVFLFNKIKDSDREDTLLALVLEEMGNYVNDSKREDLLRYESFIVEDYGCAVEFRMNETVDINPQTQNHFDAIARMKGKGSMEEIVQKIKEFFPALNEEQQYAMYATLIGLNPQVRTHIIKGLLGT